VNPVVGSETLTPEKKKTHVYQDGSFIFILVVKEEEILGEAGSMRIEDVPF
jgi:hypothetical protein